MGFKPMFNFGPEETQGNSLVFASFKEAYFYAQDKFRSWTMPTGFFVEESEDEVNYTYTSDTSETPVLTAIAHIAYGDGKGIN